MLNTAVILAAGLGSRFAGITTEIPKGCYPIGGRSLVQRSIDTLQEFGIENIVIVVGHLKHFYEELAQKNKNVSTIENPIYAKTGSMASLNYAKKLVQGKNFLLLESDLIYEKRTIKALLDDPRDNIMMLSDIQHTDDDYFFQLDGKKLGKLSKEVPTAPYGELVGVTKIGAEYAASLWEYFEQADDHYIGYEYCIDAIKNMGYILIEDLVWSEIDSHIHLERVNKEIYPKLIQKGEI
ncbi:MAG: NTP transferase domain-containing protein [Brevinema sp.]